MAAIIPNPCSCIICKKLTSQLGIQTHYKRTHGTDTDKQIWDLTNKLKIDAKQSRIHNYIKSQKYCQQCSVPLSYDQRNNKFCCSSCAASFNIQVRINNGWHITDDIKIKIGNSVSSTHAKKCKNTNNTIIGPYSNVYFKTCKYCKNIFTSNQPRKRICKSCIIINHRAIDIFRFMFNVYDYPELFDLSLIETHGWFSQGGKHKKKNPFGVSRDHKVSVSEALKHGYDHYYITHPLNCEIMLHSENNRKKHRSSISYQELIKMVDEYDTINKK
jgi:hypothetical protein